jgi:2'-5' RNA ligase
VPDRALRLFIAAPLPAGPLEECRRLIARARGDRVARGVRWVRTENLHLTLRFLGATDPEALPRLEVAIGRAASATASFAVRLAGAGAFPADRRPRTLWLGIDRGTDGLTALAGAVDRALDEVGIPPETRPFRGHLTVARTDASSQTDALLAVAGLREAAANWSSTFSVDRLVLFRSHLTAGPPRYEELASFALAA